MECPIRTELEEAVEKSRDLAHALQSLRRSLRRCDACTLAAGVCPIWQNYNEQIDAAIRQVLKEWKWL